MATSWLQFFERKKDHLRGQGVFLLDRPDSQRPVSQKRHLAMDSGRVLIKSVHGIRAKESSRAACGLQMMRHKGPDFLLGKRRQMILHVQPLKQGMKHRGGQFLPEMRLSGQNEERRIQRLAIDDINSGKRGDFFTTSDARATVSRRSSASQMSGQACTMNA